MIAMKRLVVFIAALALILSAALPSQAQVKQKGKWILDRIEIQEKPTHPDISSFTPTSITYKNAKTWSYIDEEKKEQFVSDVVTIEMTWGALPPMIEAGKEGELDIRTSLNTMPDLYNNKRFRSLRGVPGHSLDLWVKLQRVGEGDSPMSPRWDYQTDLPTWGIGSDQFVLSHTPEAFYFSGIDVTKGKHQLVVRLRAGFGGGDLQGESGCAYDVIQYYNFSSDEKDTPVRRVKTAGLSFNLEEDFQIQEQSEETYLLVPENSQADCDQLFLILNVDVLSDIDVEDIPADKLSDLMKSTARKLADIIAKNYSTAKNYTIQYKMDGRVPVAYAEFTGKDDNDTPFTCHVESKLVNGSVVSGCAVASNKELLSRMQDIYSRVVTAAANK